MMRTEPSTATSHELDTYRFGECHVFALALHRRFGWRMLAILDPEERFWENPADEGDYILPVLHVYAVDPQGNAWDVGGVRPIDELTNEILCIYDRHDHHSDELRSEEELRLYVGCWTSEPEAEPIERPLIDYTEADIAAADAVALRVLAGLPGFAPAAAP